MLPILQVGPLAIQLPGLILLLGLWLGLTLAEKHALRHAVPPGVLYNLVFVALIAGVIGARLAYAARYPGAFGANPASLISLNPGLLDPAAGLLVGGIAALVYGQRKHLAFWAVLDALTPAFAVISLSLGLAHLASGSAFGTPTSLPWGIDLWGAPRHPAQLYETIAAGVILVILWPSRSYLRGKPAGWYFLTFLALSCGARLILEAFRGDSLLLPGNLRLAQVAAWVILALCLWGIQRLTKGSAQISAPSRHQSAS